MSTATTTPQQARQELKMSNYITLFVIINILVVIVGGLVIRSEVSSALHTHRILNKKNLAEKTLVANVTAAQNIINSYTALDAPTQQKLADALPTTDDFPGLTNAIGVMAQTSGVVLQGISQDSVAATASSSGQANAMSFNVAFSASYANLQHFLQALESSARPIQVNSLTLTGRGSALTASIDAQTYSQAPAVLDYKMETVK